jgi:hypothetical protein
MYERTIDLMNEKAFPREALDVSKKNPKSDITDALPIRNQSNEAIISFVTGQMKDTLGRSYDS